MCLCSNLVQLNMSSALFCVWSGVTLLSLILETLFLKPTVLYFTSLKGLCLFSSLWFSLPCLPISTCFRNHKFIHCWCCCSLCVTNDGCNRVFATNLYCFVHWRPMEKTAKRTMLLVPYRHRICVSLLIFWSMFYSKISTHLEILINCLS